MVAAGATLSCPLGTVPCTLNVTSQVTSLIGQKPAATILDIAYPVNISGFGMCTSLLNPQVAAATAAALGVLTPQPCMLVPTGTWTPMPKVLVAGKPCFGSDAVLMCAYGGVITVTMPGQNKVMI